MNTAILWDFVNPQQRIALFSRQQVTSICGFILSISIPALSSSMLLFFCVPSRLDPFCPRGVLYLLFASRP